MPGTTTNVMTLKGDDTTYGWNLGVLFNHSENTRFGLSYKSEVKAEFEGTVTSSVMTAAPANWNADGSAKLDFPAILEFGAYHQLNEKTALYATIMETYWSSFEELAITLDNGSVIPPVTEDFQDVMRYGIGASYTLNPKWELRAGYAYDETPTTDADRNLRMPDGNRNVFSLGATWRSSDALSLDMAYQYIDSNEEPISEAPNPLVPTTVVDFTTTTSANIVALQLNYNF